MHSVEAQLATVASSLEELTRRVAEIAEANAGSRDDVTRDLYEVERVLRTAHRRLDRVVTGLG
jgi:ABC-type transporter Mla subunit MlaD